MDWLKENAEILSFGLAVVVALVGVIFWAARRKGAEAVSQRSGDRSINIVSQGDATVNGDRKADD